LNPDWLYKDPWFGALDVLSQATSVHEHTTKDKWSNHEPSLAIIYKNATNKQRTRQRTKTYT